MPRHAQIDDSITSKGTGTLNQCDTRKKYLHAGRRTGRRTRLLLPGEPPPERIGGMSRLQSGNRIGKSKALSGTVQIDDFNLHMSR
jgi:hypothetical protein